MMWSRRRLLSLVPFAPVLVAQDDWDRWDVPYVPTPEQVVDAMLKLAKVGPADTVYDLGCGDGRIVIAAAKNFGARGVGIDIDPERVKEATANAAAAGVSDKVKFVENDLFKAEIRAATVVTLYLLTGVNERLKPKLLKELKPGTRVVSHQFSMPDDWKPVRKMRKDDRQIFLWVVP